MLVYHELIKKTRAYELVLSDVKNNALGHCYFVVSSDTVAIREFFTLVACAVYCDSDACLNCLNCDRVQNGNNVDVVNLVASGKNYTVDDVKNGIFENVYKTSYYGGEKLFFIKDAEKLRSDAQNKLLKILEEPPKNVHFFLSASTEGAILDTVKSRSRKLYLAPFKSEELTIALKKAYPNVDAMRIEASVNCCGGLIDRAERLVGDEKFYSRYAETLEMLSVVKKSSDVIKYAKTKLFDKENVSQTLDILELIVNDLISRYASKDTVMSQYKGVFNTLKEEFSIGALVNVVDKIEEARQKIKFNCSTNATGENLLYSILEVKYKCRK